MPSLFEQSRSSLDIHLGKMLPAARIEGLRAPWREQDDGGLSRSPSLDEADLGHGHAGDGAGQTGGGRGGEKQFVVLAAVESLVESCRRMDGDQSRIDLRGNAGFLAQMRQIGGQSVAHVERGRGQTAASEPKALGHARLGKKVRGKLGFQFFGDSWRGGASGAGFGQLGQAGEPGCGSAERAGDVEPIAGLSAGAEQGAPARNGADQHNVGHGQGRFGQIPARQRRLNAPRPRPARPARKR